MNTKLFNFGLKGLLLLMFFITACRQEDIGPIQEENRTYSLSGFNQLEMGSGFKVSVNKGNTFAIEVKGDRRNLDDLRVRVINNTLKADYINYRNRQYRTEFTITMPDLAAVDFSGGVVSDVMGFQELDDLNFALSGASRVKFNGQVQNVNISLSGGSQLQLLGGLTHLESEISGGSYLDTYSSAAQTAGILASGGSQAKVLVINQLNAEASGGSRIFYKGNPPIVNRNTSGGAQIIQE
jgi:hypothetical protein